MVRPESAHSKLSQKAKCSLSSPGLPQRIGGFGASCSPETSLLLKNCQDSKRQQGGGCVTKGHLVTSESVGVDDVAARICFARNRAPKEKVRMLVGEGK